MFGNYSNLYCFQNMPELYDLDKKKNLPADALSENTNC